MSVVSFYILYHVDLPFIERNGLQLRNGPMEGIPISAHHEQVVGANETGHRAHNSNGSRVP